MEQLKPCPFCGWKNQRIYSRYLHTSIKYLGDNGWRLRTDTRRYYVRCNRCYSHGGTVTGAIMNSLEKPRLNYNPFWLGDDLLVDDVVQGEPEEKPELPPWVKTKAELEEKAAELWNMRLGGDANA